MLRKGCINMKSKYIFRLDDICPQMNYDNFSEIRDYFINHNIKPIIGVIPDNKDDVLISQAGEKQIPEDKFWKEILDLQNHHGWKIALHGLNHVYTNCNPGIVKINRLSEFAGLGFEKQCEMIKKGKDILESHGLCISAFMAPAHSFDAVTIEALKSNKILNITDGISAYPTIKNGVLMVPSILSWPQYRMFGINTVCLHINSWSKKRFEKFYSDMRHKWIVPIEYPTSYEPRKFDNLLNWIVMVKYKIRLLASHIKHDIICRG